MKLLVTGATGLLGSEVLRAATARGHDVTGAGSSDADVTDPVQVDALLDACRPDLVVHCAAFSAVDASEEDPRRAMAVNGDGARHVARAATRVGGRCLYVSSDYVFDGELRRPYRPDDPTSPLSVYGRSKRAGEVATLDAGRAALVVRTSWLFGHARRTFVTAMIERAARGETPTIVDDQIGGPSSARDVAAALLDLAEADAEGVWHVANRGETSWAQLAREAIRIRGIEAEIEGVSSATWNAPARRPLYSVLDVTATEERIGRPMPTWSDALARFLAEPRERVRA